MTTPILKNEIKDKLLELFKIERQNPHAEFEESHFLDYLIYPESKYHSIKNSFKGTKKYYRFLDRIEFEFGICFPLRDHDNNYSVDGLVKKVQERMNKGKGNLMILKERNKYRERYVPEIILILVLIGLYFWLGIHWFSLLQTILVAFVFRWLISSRIHNYRHKKRMTAKILTDRH
jgi:hypothetical protein